MSRSGSAGRPFPPALVLALVLVLVLVLLVALSGCGEGGDRGSAPPPDTAPPPPESAGPPPTADELRTIHARALATGPLFSDLEGEARRVGEACLEDPAGSACRAGEGLLPTAEWALVQEVVAGREGWVTDEVEREALCRMNDEGRFRAAFPGHAAFLDQVASPPPPPPGPVDAAVIIGTGSTGVLRGRRLLREGLVKEVLQVQRPTSAAPGGGPPGAGAESRDPGSNPSEAVPGFFVGYRTPDIEARLSEPRPDCLRYRSSAAVQGACRRDLAVSIARDWLRDRGHESVRVILDQQMTWPEIEVLFRRLMPEVELFFDPEFEVRLSRSSTFITEMCGIVATEELWQEYRFFVRTLFPG